MRTLVLLAIFFIQQTSCDKSFVISLKDIDSGKSLLEQIYKRAESIGFEFNKLSDTNQSKLENSLLADATPPVGTPGTKKSGSAGTQSKAPTAPKSVKKTPAKTQAPKTSALKDKKPKTKPASVPKNTASKAAKNLKAAASRTAAKQSRSLAKKSKSLASKKKSTTSKAALKSASISKPKPKPKPKPKSKEPRISSKKADSSKKLELGRSTDKRSTTSVATTASSGMPNAMKPLVPAAIAGAFGMGKIKSTSSATIQGSESKIQSESKTASTNDMTSSIGSQTQSINPSQSQSIQANDIDDSNESSQTNSDIFSSNSSSVPYAVSASNSSQNINGEFNSVSSDFSSVPYSTNSFNNDSMSVPYSMSEPVLSQDFSSLASPSYSVETSILDMIQNLSSVQVNSVVNNCTECSKVESILVYKDGDVWKDYSGNIEMNMVDGKLCDKSGAFVGKDCGCSKEKIPEIGKLGDVGLYQDKGVNSQQCSMQSALVDHLVQANPEASSSFYQGDQSFGASDGLASVGPNGNSNNNNMSQGSNSMDQGSDSMSQVSDSMGQGSSNMSESSPIDLGNSGIAQSSAFNFGNESLQPNVMPQAPSTSSFAASPSIQPQASYSQPVPSAATPQLVFKAVKLDYDPVPSQDCEEKVNCRPKTKPKIKIKTRTRTVTLIEQKQLPAKTIMRTVTKMVVPDTVTKTLTQVLKAEPVTITQKPDTVIKYAAPKTITKHEQIPPNTVTITKTKVKKIIEEPSEDRIDEPIKKTIETQQKSTCEPEETVTVSKTVSVSKGVECLPDCACEEEKDCDNPCMEIRCEIIE